MKSLAHICVGSNYHTQSAQRDKINKMNGEGVRNNVVRMITKKIVHLQYSQKRQDEKVCIKK